MSLSFRLPGLAVALLVLVGAGVASAASGGTALQVSHSGFLLTAADAPVEAAGLAMKFRVYTLAESGTLEWEAACTSVVVHAGYYAVTLGGAGQGCTGISADPVLDTSDLPAAQERFLEVEVGAVVLTPRLSLAVLPATASALDSQRLGGALPAAFHDAGLLTGVVPPSVLGAGSPDLTTVGVIGTGTWQGTPVADAYIGSAVAWNARLAGVAHDGTLAGDGTAGSNELRVNVGTTAGSVAAGDDGRFGQWTGGAAGLVAATGRTSLQLGTAATTNLTDYATAAQGATADAALARAGGTITGAVNFPGSGVWNAAGNVGIGTTTPTAKLEVLGDIFGTRITAPNSMQEWSGSGVFIPSSANNPVNYVNLFSNTGGYGWMVGTLTWWVGQSQVHCGQISFSLSRYGLISNTLTSSNAAYFGVSLYANPGNPEENYLRFTNSVGTSWGNGTYTFNLQVWGGALSSAYLTRTR